MNKSTEPSSEEQGAPSLGERTWEALREHRITPTPHSFEVFYTLLSGTNSLLEQEVRHLSARGEPLTIQRVEALHRVHVGSVDDTVLVAASAGDLAEAAQEIVEQVTLEGEALRVYGSALDYWRAHLQANADVEGLVRAVANLTAETERASARNRALEMQLIAEVSRVERLREDLVQVQQEAATDALTGIPNRRTFDFKLRRAINNNAANPSNRFALLMLDVDHFKRFNDEHGHTTGDQVLRLVARLLADNVKGRDTAARFGGEEFAVLLSDTDLAGATIVAQQLCDRLAKQRLIKRGTGKPVGQITMSIGVTTHEKGESDVEMIGRADAALYEAKRTGRNRVCCASSADAAEQ